MLPAQNRCAARRLTAALSVLFGLVGAIGSGCGERAEEARPPHLILIVIDTLRADRLGAYGGPEGLTPFLDAFARGATLFENTYAPSSWTIPSVASLFTSRFPSQHKVVDFDSVLAAEELTLAEALAPLGYRAGGFTANFRLGEQFGYAQGFEHWQPLLLLSGESTVPGDLKARAPLVNEHALRWLDEGGTDSSRPNLLYLHYLDPHPPYLPPEPHATRHVPERQQAAVQAANRKLMDLSGRGRASLTPAEVSLLEALYDAEVAALDAALASLFDSLGQRGLLEHALIVITADHGEEFREHGRLLHGQTLYEESIRVPLLIKLPGQTEGQRVATPVSLVDLAPTLVELLGLDARAPFEGRSRAAALRRETSPPGHDDVLAELIQGTEDEERVHRAALWRGRRKLLMDHGETMTAFDLDRDPEEQIDPPERVDASMVDALTHLRTALEERALPDGRTRPLDERTRQDLRALGYAVE